MKRIIITGGSGLLGKYLTRELCKKYDLLVLFNENIPDDISKSIKIDLRNISELEKLFSGFKPEIVVHTAAFSKPELCEKMSKDSVYLNNVTVTEEISRLCLITGSKLIFTSSDLVYDGNQSSMLKEDSILNPISVYARSKFEAENKIKGIFDNFIILRTALMYGISVGNSHCFFENMYNNLSQNNSIRLFKDQYRTPLSFFEAARIISKLCEADIKNEIINFGGTQRCSRVELGRKLCQIAGFDLNLIEEISMNDITNIIPVADVSLNTNKINSLGINRLDINNSIKEILNHNLWI
jgi:dTDP-4-dehydrorhamnose reductase